MIPDPEIQQYLNYNSQTGEFLWIKKSGQRGQVGTVAGALNRGYRQIKFRRVLYKAHQLAWWWVHGVWPQNDIDHRNLDRGDNRIRNLRLATRSRNMANGQRHRDNKSGYKGVCRARSGRWQATIGVNGRTAYLGNHETSLAAACAYDVAAKAAFGEFARFNFPASEAAVEDRIAAQGATGGSGGFLSG